MKAPLTALTTRTTASTRRRPRRIVPVAAALLGLAVALPLATMSSASASTTTSRHQATLRHTHLSGTTSVTTAPGIANALVSAGVLPLPVLPSTSLRVTRLSPLQVTYGFPVISGQPDLAGPSGHVYHSGGIYFASRRAHLEIGRFDMDLAKGKIFARQVNFASARIPVLDLDLSGLKVATVHGATVLSGIVVRLDPAAAGALNSTFGLALPTDGSLVFGSATVTLRS
jgi:hypothetical protein